MIDGITFSNEKAYRKQARLWAIGIDFQDYRDAEVFWDDRICRDFWRELGNEEVLKRFQGYMDCLVQNNERKASIEPDWDDVRDAQFELAAIEANPGGLLP